MREDQNPRYISKNNNGVTRLYDNFLNCFCDNLDERLIARYYDYPKPQESKISLDEQN